MKYPFSHFLKLTLVIIDSPELLNEVPGHVDQSTSSYQASECPENPDNSECRHAFGHQRLIALETLVEVAHVPIVLPHFQQDFSCVEHLLFPHPLQV